MFIHKYFGKLTHISKHDPNIQRREHILYKAQLATLKCQQQKINVVHNTLAARLRMGSHVDNVRRQTDIS